MNRLFLYKGIAGLIPVFCLAICVLGACGEVEEPAITDLIVLLSGSDGFEGDGAIHGLRGGERYLLKHERKEAIQERDPLGKVRVHPLEDWYVVDAQGGIAGIADTPSDIPSIVQAGRLNNGTNVTSRDHVISGLINGEKYRLYFYGRPAPEERITRLRGVVNENAPLATYTCNSVLNIRHFVPGNTVVLAEYIINGTTGITAYQSHSQLFNDNNEMIVLVGTPLYFHEDPRSVGGYTGASLRIRGYDFDVIVESGDDRPLPGYEIYDGRPVMRAEYGLVTVAPILRDGQKYFVLTAHTNWRGKIYITDRQ